MLIYRYRKVWYTFVKKHIILAVLLILCLIPTAVAISSYKETQNAPVDEKTAVSLSIDDVNGKNYLFERNAGDDAENMILFFLKMQANATKIVALPDSLTGEQYFKVTLSNSVKQNSYQYYFDPNPQACYFVDPDGLVYQIAEKDAREFIGTEYAESIYEAAAMPVLTLSGDHTVIPDTAEWRYKNYTGEYVLSDTSAAVSADVESYSLEGGFELLFDQDPDYFALKIHDDKGELLYDGMYADLNTTFHFEANTRLNVEVIAEWYDDPERSYCGDLTYNFTSLVTAPAEFYVGMDTVKVGRFVAVTALNILNPEKIQFTSEPSIGYTPTFYMEGDKAIGLIPFNPSLAAGTYVMTFTYGGTTQNITMQVEGVNFGSSDITVSSTLLSLYRTKDSIAAFEDLVAQLTTESESTRYFSGYFLEGMGGVNGMPGSRQILRGFNREIIINSDASNTYRNSGVTTRATAGTGVYAANAGKVIYAGVMDYTGNIVVIDHGMGLKTWYYNMGSYSAAVGDVVEKGTQIGTCGDTGFAPSGSGVQVAMSVGSQFVCPYDTWSDSSTVGKVAIWGVDPLGE